MLVTAQDIRKHRPMADNLDSNRRLSMYIEEAERLYIIPALGAPLYKDVCENPSAHTLLLEGGYYSADTRHCAGLKAATALLAYARFVRNQHINVTPFGVKEKLSLDSADVDDRTLVRHANEAESTGKSYLRQCIDYLRTQNGGCATPTASTQRKYRAIGE